MKHSGQTTYGTFASRKEEAQNVPKGKGLVHFSKISSPNKFRSAALELPLCSPLCLAT